MKRTLALAAVLMASMMIVQPVSVADAANSQPASNLSDEYVVGSSHSDSQSFNDAKTLDNLTIVGTGEDAYLEFGAGGATWSDSFDEQSADSGLPDGWSTSDTFDSTNVTTARSYDGTQSFAASTDASATSAVADSGEPGSATTNQLSFAIWADAATDYASVKLVESGSRITIVGIRDGDLQYIDGTGSWNTISTTPNAGEWVQIDINNIDVANDEFDLDWSTSGESGTATDLSFETGVSNGYDNVGIRTSDSTGFFDAFQIGSTGSDTGQYVSANHSVSRAEAATLNITSENATFDWRAEYFDSSSNSWKVGNSTTISTTANHSLLLPDVDSSKWRANVSIDNETGTTTARIHDETVMFDNRQPSLTSLSPPDGENLQTEGVTLEANVSDAEFATAQGDSVTVDFMHKPPDSSSYSTVATKTATSNKSLSTSLSNLDGGTHEWKVVANDSYEQSATVTGGPRTFNVPSMITFRTEQPGHAIIKDGTDPITVEATFFEDVEDSPTIINRTTTDGTIELDGLPVSSEFSVSVSAPGYHNRTVRLENIFEQNTIFLIEKQTATTVENRFVVNDRTGNFPAGQTEISIQAPINQSLYDTGGFEWLSVSGDDLGADESYVDDLIEEKRYRIVVENDNGDTRILGAYTPETSGTIELNIGSVQVNPDESGGVGMNATWFNASGTEKVRIEYNDTVDATDRLYVNVYERNNESNTLINNESFSGPFGTFSHTEDVPAGEEDTTWVVEVHGERSTNADGEAVEDVQFKEYAGPTRNVLTQLPDWLVAVFFVGLIWGVAGLFSQVNGHVGGIVVAGLGGMLFFVGIVPNYLGGGVVALSLLTAGILFVRESRAGAF